MSHQQQAAQEIGQQLDFYQRYQANLELAEFQGSQPVVGILMMPFWNDEMQTNDFQYSQFTWEHNVNFVQYAGSFAIPLRYDLGDEDLY